MKKYIVNELLETLESRFGDEGYIFERSGDGFLGHTYKDFARDVRGFAGYLQGNGLLGKRIGICAKNSYEYMVSDIAVMSYVGTMVCFSKEWQYSDLERGCEFTGISALIYSADKADSIEKLKQQHGDIIYIPIEDILGHRAEYIESSPIGYEECSKIVFSSGTTGVPKAVMLSQKNMFVCWDALYKRAPFHSADRCYMFLPLHHTYAAICIFLYSLISGMKIYVCSELSKMSEEILMSRPTVFCTVPLVLERTYSVITSQCISPSSVFGTSLKYLFCGGAILKPEIKKYFLDNAISLFNSYGLSETSSLISIDYPFEYDTMTVGTVMENIDVRINDPNEQGMGEIAIRSENVFLGYYNDPERSKSAFDGDGYFCTGDIGYLRGRKLYISGRKKRVIILSNGENIYPEEIESRFDKFKAVGKVKIYEKDGRMYTDIFVKEDTDIESMLNEINQDLPKTHRVKYYNVIRDSFDKRLK